MTGLDELPDFVYLDEARVRQRMQLVNQGRVTELVETYSETSSKTSGGGLSIYKILEYNRQNSSEAVEEVSRTIQETPIGQFSVFFSLIDDEVGITELDSLTRDGRDELRDDDYVIVSGKIQESPVAKLMRLSETVRFDVESWLESSSEGGSAEGLMDQLEASREYYQIDIDGEVDGRYVFRLSPENMLDIANRFPKEYTEYTVFGRVEHLFEQGERKHHLSFMDEMNVQDRGRRNEMRRSRKKMAEELSGLYDEEVDESMFYIESPDILVSPIAVYS